MVRRSVPCKNQPNKAHFPRKTVHSWFSQQSLMASEQVAFKTKREKKAANEELEESK